MQLYDHFYILRRNIQRRGTLAGLPNYSIILYIRRFESYQDITFVVCFLEIIQPSTASLVIAFLLAEML